MLRHLLPLFLCATCVAAEAPSFLVNGVTAHRGDSAHHPENTIAAFAAGIAAGADWIELDIHRTRDGRLIVCHDKTTGRTCDRDLVIGDSSYEDLKALDAASGFRRQHALTLEQCPPDTLPLLEDVLRLVITQHATRCSIQPKMDCVADAISLVRRIGAENWVGFNDGSLELMSTVKRLAPAIPVFWDRADSPVAEDIRIAREKGFETLVVKASALTPARAAQIQQAGLTLGVWTVDGETEWGRFLDMGVHRIYTDDPAGLLALQARRGFRPIACQGAYPMHLQGICSNERDAIYWAWTTALVKTDLQGRVLRKVTVANHHGDVCFHDGRLYCAVNLGKFNRPAGEADSWVYVYDGESLAELARHPAPEAVHGAGGIAWHDGRFIVVGGLPPDTDENYLFEYDMDFRFQRRHVLRSGYTLMGIQTAAYADGSWWFGCYGKPARLLRAGEDLGLTGSWEFNASVGILPVKDGSFLIASNQKGPAGNTARLSLARADAGRGLVLTPERQAPAKAPGPDRK